MNADERRRDHDDSHLGVVSHRGITVAYLPCLYLCLSAFICGLFSVEAHARLGPLEQMQVEDFAKLREVERYQLKIAEQYYLK